jgi:four helix bundle protein
MATIKHHEDIVAWQLASELKKWVFKIISRPSVARHFKFCDQIRTSSRSGPANISEGFWRYRPRDNARFVRIALGSLGETANHLNDAFAENYIGEEEYKEVAKLARRALSTTIAWHTHLMTCPERAPDPHSNKPPRGRVGKPEAISGPRESGSKSEPTLKRKPRSKRNDPETGKPEYLAKPKTPKPTTPKPNPKTKP